jgi:hypothetical protein
LSRENYTEKVRQLAYRLYEEELAKPSGTSLASLECDAAEEEAMPEPKKRLHPQKPANPGGEADPMNGRDRTYDPGPETEEVPGLAPDQLGPDASEEAKNQAAAAKKSVAQSGQP